MGVKKSREELSIDKRIRNKYAKAAISEPILEETLKFQGEEMMEKKKKTEKEASPYAPEQQ